jgi:outer membrane lipoprotein-sorting protein
MPPMKYLASFSASVLLLAACAAGQPRSQAELDQALAKMETVGRTFRSFQANFAQKKYTLVLDEFDAPESGQFFYARAKDGSALLRQEVQKPASRVLTISGGVATVYQPGVKQAQVVSLGKNKDKAEYLALGLGQSPGRLQESFTVEYKGTEALGGSPCWILHLKPKSQAAAAYFSGITLWVKKSSGVPVQEKLQEPNGDYLLVTFSDEKLNIQIPESKFEQKLPPGTDIQRLQ